MFPETRHAVNQNVATNKLNPIAFRKAKILYNFGLSECYRVTVYTLKLSITIWQQVITVFVYFLLASRMW